MLEFESKTVLMILLLSLFHLENRVYLSCGVQVAGAAWWAATSIVVGVGDLMKRIGDGHTSRVLSGWAIERLGGAVCGLHRVNRDKKHIFLGSASKLRSTVCQWFDLKTTRIIFSDLPLKLVVTIFSSLASKSVVTVFFSLALKSVATISPGLASKPVARVS
jgi:hypothetical protein